ncbi:MAG: cupin domain-containing protein [Acidobacteria bacterium]|nr:cupin domain-containing protein [Acidobacteriota bacterium]
MGPYRIRFSDSDGWQESGGFRSKREIHGSTSLRLLEILSTASHPEWCEVGHAGAVIEGSLEIEFQDRTLRYEPGDALLIPPGPAHRHRPRAVTDRVRLVLVDDPGGPEILG